MSDDDLMRDGWPIVVLNDDGIRPAGPQDACLYCGMKIGRPHTRDCVVVTKRVRIRYTIEVDVDMPHFWEKSNIEYNRNGGSWCADNAIDEFREIMKRDGCLCGSLRAEFVAVVDETPRRELRTHS